MYKFVMNPQLTTHSTLTVKTRDGDRQIQLCFGDLTHLSKEEKVDVIIISAFPGDYTPTVTSVIGALQSKFRVNVRNLAKHKQEDLRRHFHCWWSYPLPEYVPYGRLLCFETPYSRVFRHPADFVSDVFRALVPAFNNEEKSVITPLLSTGDQNFSKLRMMRAMLEAAINWIRAGLPMKCLKIVLYTRTPQHLDATEEEVVQIFQDMKEKLEKAAQQEQIPEILYDMYLSYHENDKPFVQKIENMIRQLKCDIKLFTMRQDMNDEIVWQKDMYDKMMKSRRVATFLSPDYLQSRGCLEQFNIALCCNRSERRNILAPFYISTIDPMPTYMALVQYIDCREGKEEKMEKGLQSFVLIFKISVNNSLLKPLSQSYDVFISYAHKNSEKAQFFLEYLQKLHPEMKIFFDRNELKTGSSWQHTLFNAIDNTKVILCLTSPEYFDSKVCQEEYNLALCQHLSEEHSMDIVAVLVNPMETISRKYCAVPMVDATKHFEPVARRVCEAIVALKDSTKKDELIFGPQLHTYEIDEIHMEKRRQFMLETFTNKEGVPVRKGLHLPDPVVPDNPVIVKRTETPCDEKENESSDKKSTEESESERVETSEASACNKSVVKSENPDKEIIDDCDVAFICADYREGLFLRSLLKYRAPNITSNFENDNEKSQLDALERAKLIVVLMSQNFVRSGKEVDEFHIALARHRNTVGKPILYPIHVTALPRWPTYFHAIPCRIACYDHHWKNYAYSNTVSQPNQNDGFSADIRRAALEIVAQEMEPCPPHLMMALSAACFDIIAVLQQASDGKTHNTTISNLAQMLAENKGHDMDKPIMIQSYLRNLPDVEPKPQMKKNLKNAKSEEGTCEMPNKRPTTTEELNPNQTDTTLAQHTEELNADQSSEIVTQTQTTEELNPDETSENLTPECPRLRNRMWRSRLCALM